MAGGTGGGGQPGQIQGSDIANALFGTQVSDLAMQKRYQQLGLGQIGTTATGAPAGAPPTSGGTSFRPGGGTAGGAGASSGWGVNPGSGTTPTTPGSFGPGPTGFQMDIGGRPSWTGAIPQEFQGALGEGQFQDLSATTSAAVGAQQAKGQAAAGIGSLIGGI